MNKGIILAGGLGSRLNPLTLYTSKHLLPVYDKPMIYYPISTLMLGGIKEIAIISTSRDLNQYKTLLGDGSKFGIKFEYLVQDKPAGIADAFLVAEEFINNSPVSLILGDNVFHGNMRLSEIFGEFKEGALIFGYPVANPKEFGVVEFDSSGKVIDIVEKPEMPKSKYAVPGLYLYDNRVVDLVKNMKPSSRGELEITDLNRIYLGEKELNVKILGRGISWIDAGNCDSLIEIGNYIRLVEKRQSFKIGCLEEVALRKNFIDIEEFNSLILSMPNCNYKDYLSNISEEYQGSSFKVRDLNESNG